MEYAAELIGSAPDQDLAVLESTRQSERFLPLTTSNDLKVGQSTHAIGNPFGLVTLPTGVISALDREMQSISGRIFGVIQTDAAMNWATRWPTARLLRSPYRREHSD